tara:strand:+ start:556 stop:822 length:267 start_codon:yes stop_codon:yes gene_type:complete
MDMNEFVEGMNKLRREHGFCIEEDCDLWSLMKGFIFYRNMESEKSFAHITGVRYTSNGDGLEGDFKGVLELMTKAVNDEYKVNQGDSK